jgi:hypothetical protein
MTSCWRFEEIIFNTHHTHSWRNSSKKWSSVIFFELTNVTIESLEQHKTTEFTHFQERNVENDTSHQEAIRDQSAAIRVCFKT